MFAFHIMHPPPLSSHALPNMKALGHISTAPGCLDQRPTKAIRDALADFHNALCDWGHSFVEKGCIDEQSEHANMLKDDSAKRA